MARNKFDVDEELEQEFSWKDFKRLARYVVPYKASIGKVLFTIILANLAGMLAPVFTKLRSIQLFLTRIKCSCFDRCCVCCDTADH